jgi:hypothetical protein
MASTADAIHPVMGLLVCRVFPVSKVLQELLGITLRGDKPTICIANRYRGHFSFEKEK